MANRQRQLIIILGAVLLAVIVGSGAVLWSFGSRTTTDGPEPAATGQAPTESPVSVGIGTGFDTTVLRSSRYTTLDQQLVNDGSLPVQPPAGVGKANPFL